LSYGIPRNGKPAKIEALIDGILTCGSTPGCLILISPRKNWIARGQRGEIAIAGGIVLQATRSTFANET
jgi:hypothetical protein